MAKALEVEEQIRILREHLHLFVKAIVDVEDYNLEIIDEIIKVLNALKELKLKDRSHDSLKVVDNYVVPHEFICPISKKLMNDPVILANGQTYDRPYILRWLSDGHRTCPKTQQVLSHTILTPNKLVQEMILQWRKEKGIDLAKPVQDVENDIAANPGIRNLNSLLQKMSSSSLPDQKVAAKEIRQLTKKLPSFRDLFGESTDAMSQLLNPISADNATANPDLQEDLVTAILNISIPEHNKKIVPENPLVIPFLVESLKSRTMETRRNAAAALFTLSSHESNKVLIGECGALKPLIELLEQGSALAMKDAAAAISNLCLFIDNKRKAVRDGAVSIILKKIMDGLLVDELLFILALLASHQKAAEEMGKLGAVSCLLRLIRNSSTSEKSKENCVGILYVICFNDRSKFRDIREEENAFSTLTKLAETGTSRAKRKAGAILEMLHRVISLSHTA